MKLLPAVVISSMLCGILQPGFAEEPAKPGSNATKERGSPHDDQSARFQKLTEQLSQVKLIGQFTVVGRENGALSKEEYTIQKVEKLAEGDKWMFYCRIKYGDHDRTLPLPLDVKWAGDTPIITLTDLTIPGMGTFSSRVVLHDGKYAGTWRHDHVSGHLFGIMEKAAKEAPAARSADGSAPSSK